MIEGDIKEAQEVVGKNVRGVRVPTIFGVVRSIDRFWRGLL